MSVQIRWRGDTTAAHSGFVGAEREITIDTDKRTIVVHDGKTMGGFPMAREDFANLPPKTWELIRAFIENKLVGTIVAAPLDSVEGFLLCDGSAVLREGYKRLFGRIGTNFGAGDGSTTFNIPDYRGYFLRGKGGNSAADFATAQGDAIRNIAGKFDGNINDNNANKTGPFYVFSTAATGGDGGGGGGCIGFDASRVVPTADENRPVNKAINFFIKF